MNNKGFTMVEILGVVVILGILMSVAIGGVTIYRDKAAQQSYDTMAKSSTNAVTNYIMDYPDDSGAVFIKDLYEESYLERPADPNDEGKECNGVVVYNKNSGTGGDKLDSYDYKVHLCCANYEKTYNYPSGTVTDIEEAAYCKNLSDDKIDMHTGLLKKPPTCSIELEGSKNASGVYTSDVKVKLKTGGTVTGKGLATSNSPTYNESAEVNHTTDGNSITYYGYVKNAMGETSCSKTFKKDGSKPTLTVVNNSNEQWVNQNVVLNITSSDSNGIAAVDYSYDKNTWYNDFGYKSPDLTSIIGTWYVDRNQKVYIRATDKSGNTTIKETMVKIDKTPPVFTSINVECGVHEIHTNLRRFLRFKFNDTGSGLGKRDVSWTWYTDADVFAGSSSSSTNFGGAATAGDRLWDNAAKITYSITICDLANNCVTESGDKVPMSPPVCP